MVNLITRNAEWKKKASTVVPILRHVLFGFIDCIHRFHRLLVKEQNAAAYWRDLKGKKRSSSGESTK